MLVELDLACRFSHGVADILIGADRKGLQLLGLAPVEQGKVLDINVLSAFGRGLSLYHKNGTGVINHEIGRSIKREAKVGEDRAYI